MAQSIEAFTRTLQALLKQHFRGGWMDGEFPGQRGMQGDARNAVSSASLALPHIANGLMQAVWYQIRSITPLTALIALLHCSSY